MITSKNFEFYYFYFLPKQASTSLRYSNFLDTPWENDIIWGDDDDEENFETLRKPRRPAAIVLDLNDDNMLLNTHFMGNTTSNEVEEEVVGTEVVAPRRGRKKKVKPTEGEPEVTLSGVTATSLDPFNLSNDKFYEMKKQRKSERVRHGVGKLVLRHSLPAIRLEYPYVSFLFSFFLFFFFSLPWN